LKVPKGTEANLSLVFSLYESEGKMTGDPLWEALFFRRGYFGFTAKI